MKSHHVWIETQQQQLINKLKQDLRALRFERDKLAYFMKVGIGRYRNLSPLFSGVHENNI
jgi:hypothetical protein